jgi:integrase/recombinase XerC
MTRSRWVGVSRSIRCAILASHAAWALAEATVRTSELSKVTIGDINLEARTVRIAGSTKTQLRVGALTEWGVAALARRVDSFGPDAPAGTLVVYEGDGSTESRQATCCVAISDTLRRAGLAQEPDVRPVSIAAWAGKRVFDETSRIEAAAQALGMRSLDRAARLIGWDWADLEHPR